MVSAVLLVLEARKLEHSREVCDGKRRILVEVLRLDEALEQVPAHGGWRAGRWVLWCWEVGMGVGRVYLPVVRNNTMEMR